jgi:hypothetical protein
MTSLDAGLLVLRVVVGVALVGHGTAAAVATLLSRRQSAPPSPAAGEGTASLSEAA